MSIKPILRAGPCDFIIRGWLAYIYVNNAHAFDHCEATRYTSLTSYQFHYFTVGVR